MSDLTRLATLRITIALAALLASSAQPTSAANRSTIAAGCGRACLTQLMTDYLNALVSGDGSRVKARQPVRFTQDQQELKFGVGGVWSHKVGLTGYRFDMLDVHAGIAAGLVKVQIDGKPALMAVRLLTRAGRISGVESIVVHSRDEGMIFNVDAIQTLSPAMTLTPPAALRNTRDDMIAIASRYPRGLQTGSFAKVDVPFAPNAYRFENGRLMAGPGCTFFAGCEHIKTQRIPTLSKLEYRIAAVDEEQGVVLIRMDFGPGSVFERPGGPKGQSLSVFEAFKVYGGQIHAVEAFMKVKPAEQPLGWN